MILAKAGELLEHPQRRRGAGGVGHRMGGLDHLDPAGRPAMAVAGDDQPLAGAPGLLHRLGHARRGLAGADHEHPSGGARRQHVGQPPHRIGDRDGAVEERAQQRRRVLPRAHARSLGGAAASGPVAAAVSFMASSRLDGIGTSALLGRRPDLLGGRIGARGAACVKIRRPRLHPRSRGQRPRIAASRREPPPGPLVADQGPDLEAASIFCQEETHAEAARPHARRRRIARRLR